MKNFSRIDLFLPIAVAWTPFPQTQAHRGHLIQRSKTKQCLYGLEAGVIPFLKQIGLAISVSFIFVALPPFDSRGSRSTLFILILFTYASIFFP